MEKDKKELEKKAEEMLEKVKDLEPLENTDGKKFKSRRKKPKKKRVRFIKPIDKNTSYLGCVWYGVKAYITGVLSLIAIPMNIIGALTGVLVWLIVIGMAVGGIVYKAVYPELVHSREVAYDALANMKDSDFSMVSDTEIYDKDGDQIGLINSGHFEYVDINDISMKIQNGYIAVEDKRFKTHPGFDWISIARAALALVKNNGEITQGGSTITQQLVKNTYLTQEQTWSRKLTEVFLAYDIERVYTKADIMEFYCNTNFYGHRCYGVEAASNYYFGKSAKDVDWDEAAMLIGLSNAPSAYDPVNNPEAALEKRNRVLDTIAEEGYITDEELEMYKAKPLDIVQEYAEGTLENYQTSYAIHCAAIELMKNDHFKFKYTFNSLDEYNKYVEDYNNAYNDKSELIRAGGYKIYTTLDSNVQSMVQEALDNGLSRFTTKQENGKYALQGAAVVVDNQTNNVIAIVGGRGADDLFNRGYLAIRQPGSSIKPLIDYAPAFDTGEYYPSKIMNDHKWEDGPSNSGGNYRGNITIREALNRSINTIAWQVLQNIGVKNGLDYLGKMEFRNISFVDNSAEAVSIGGFTNGTRVVDMAKGFSTLANEGVYSDKTCITSIVAEKGGELYSGDEEKTQVYEEDSAYMVTDILKGTMDVEYATGRGLDIPGQQAAGKTGTTNSNKDAWYVGYTRYYTTAVWMGYDTPQTMPGVYGATYAGKIWQNVMTKLHEGLPEWDWERPETVIESFYDPATGERTDADTGVRDLFSTTADARAAEARAEREREESDNRVKANVESYATTNIRNVEDTYNIESNYQNIMNEISLVYDDDLRKELGNRATSKYNELVETRNSMSDAIAEYERQKEEESLAAIESSEAAAEEERLAQEKELRLDSFNRSISEIKKMKYQQDNAEELVLKAYDELKKLVDIDEYNDLLKQLQDTEKWIKTLPTKAEWDRMEAERIAREESIAASEAESRAEEESKRAAELESIQESIRESQAAETAPIGPGMGNYGPGMNIGPNGSSGGPGTVYHNRLDPTESAAASTER